MTEARLPISEQRPALSKPYKSAQRPFLSVKGQRTIAAGTFEIIWLSKIEQTYSCPATTFFKKSAIAGFLQIEDEKIKKHKKVSRRT